MPNRALRVALTLLALVAAAWVVPACGGGGGGRTPTQPPPPPPPPPTGDVAVDVREFAFNPKSGQTVVWQLEGDLTNHNVIALAGRFSGSLSQPDATFRQTFTEDDRNRTFEYRCSTHQGCCMMQGSVRVGANAPAPQPGY
jgi:hypothetical protein